MWISTKENHRKWKARHRLACYRLLRMSSPAFDGVNTASPEPNTKGSKLTFWLALFNCQSEHPLAQSGSKIITTAICGAWVSFCMIE